MDAIEKGIGKMKDAGANIKEKIKGEDIHRNLCNDQQDRHHSSSSSSKDHEKDPKSGRNGSVGEQLLGMKKKIVVNHVNIKPKKPDAKSEVNGDDRKIVEDLTQRLGEAEEREKILIKKINELENELKLMKQPSEVEEPQRRLSEAGHKREPSHSAQSSRRPSGENNNFLSPFRRPSDGRVSPSSGQQKSDDCDDEDKRGSDDGRGRDRSRDRATDGGGHSDQRACSDGKSSRSDDQRGQKQDRQRGGPGHGGHSPAGTKSPGDRSPNHSKDQKRKESTGGQLMFGR